MVSFSLTPKRHFGTVQFLPEKASSIKQKDFVNIFKKTAEVGLIKEGN